MKDYTAEARESQRAYQAEWRRTHKENVRENTRRYWERRAAKEAAASQERSFENDASTCNDDQ